MLWGVYYIRPILPLTSFISHLAFPPSQKLFNVLLRIDFTVREDGASIIENLLLGTFGINLLLLGCTTIGLHTFERYIVNRYLHRLKAATTSDRLCNKPDGPQQQQQQQHPSESDPLLSNTTRQSHHSLADDAAEFEHGDEDLWAESIAYHLGNIALTLLAALLFLINMLAVPPYGTQASQRSDWFWFW